MRQALIVIFLTLSIALMAASTSLELQTDFPRINTDAEYSRLNLDGAQIHGNPGEPALPWLGTKILLPLGEEAVSISVKRSQAQLFKLEKPLMPIQEQYPLSMQDLPPMKTPDSQIYSSAAAWPAQLHNGVNTQFLAGHPINFSAVCPFEYYPLSNELIWYKSITVSVESAPSPRAFAALTLLKQEKYIQARLDHAIDNQNKLPRYDTRSSGIEYLIICDQAKINQWTPLRDFYTDRGLNVMMMPVQRINALPGADLQEKIRNYIIQVYQSNSLRYVLLAGDTDIIPHRGLYVNFGEGIRTDYDIPADMYYSCLDGNWNDNGNNKWGEPDEADLIPELDIGRICYNSNTEIENQIYKIIAYHDTPVESETKTALFLGEYMWDEPTWGGDYMDELIGGASTHGYTSVGVPESWNITKLYDRTNGSNNSWGATQLLPLLSQGANLINHMGHSNTTYCMRLNNDQLTTNNITNNGTNHNFSIYFSQGCYPGAFDNRSTTVGNYTSDCFSEKLTSLPTAAVAMISHSRYGWGRRGSTNGASQHIHRQYIDAIFGENIHDLGHSLTDAKIDNIPFIVEQGIMRWVCYETNLFGDPALSIWTDTPQQLTAQLPDSWDSNQLSYQIATNAPFAQIRIKSAAAILYEEYANETGLIYVQLSTGLQDGEYEIYITAPNYYPYTADITVTTTYMTYVVAKDIILDDDDGLLHTGEEISLGLTLKNSGNVDLNSVGTLVISSNSPNIQILSHDTIVFNSIAAGDSIVMGNIFQILITGGFEDGKTITIDFDVTFEDNSSHTVKTLQLSAPHLAVDDYYMISPNPIFYPGDSPKVAMVLKNEGSGHAYSPWMTLVCDHPQVQLSQYEIQLPMIAAYGEITASELFAVHIPRDMALDSDIDIHYTITSENGNLVQGSIRVHVGLLVYDFELDEMGWSSVDPDLSFTNQWHRTLSANHTPNGAFSMKFGGLGTIDYMNESFGALESPLFTLGQNSRFKFFHRMDAQAHETPGFCHDGGFVQMSLNGGEWIQVSPVGGYSHQILESETSPLPANTLCFSGSFDWREETIDLSAYSGRVRFRFLFGSDDSGTAEGWYIDDVRMESDYVSSEDPVQIPPRLALAANYPNPFNPYTSISFSLPASDTVELAVYNMKGQKIRTLVSGTLNAGTHSFVFDGKDESGKYIASGVYLYHLSGTVGSLTRKMVLKK